MPTYRSLMVHYDPEVIPYGVLVKKLKGLLNQLDHIRIPPSDVLEIPVLYGGEEMGPDLGFVAEHNHKTPDEVIRIHTPTEYLIYMLGFTPGFTYLGGMSAAPCPTSCQDSRRQRRHRRQPDGRISHRLPGRLAAYWPHARAHVRP